MAPVIRISDEVFRKLQLLGEPLVDTPNSVIEKLLDRATDAGARQARPPAPAARIREEHQRGGAKTPGVFLAPANEENIKTTLARTVPLGALQQRLDSGTFERLRNALNGKTAFQCWAMTTASRGTYDNMRPGDVVLFAPKGTGRFTYRATVASKLESQQLGDILWPVTPNQPWSLVYLLDEVRSINLSKEKLVAEFGYDRGFPVYGITRVAPQRVEAAVSRRGSLENVLGAAAVQRST